MNYPQFVNNYYECDKYNTHGYIGELQSVLNSELSLKMN
jgi:hypothetical protein